MSNGPQSRLSSATINVSRAIKLLEEALAIIDNLNHPDIGARLQDVIESLAEAEDDSEN
jgi:hypothetical protein